MPNRSTAPSATTTWTTAGVIALPVSAVLLAVGTLTPQPDQASDPDGWARFVTSTSYLPSHIATTLVGAALMILGTFALTVLIAGRAPRLAPTGMLLAVTGQVFFSVPAVVSTFVTPAIGQAYLNGNQAVMTLEFPAAMTAITLVALLLTVVGNIILGIAAARSGVVPRWAGIVWATATVIFYVLGLRPRCGHHRRQPAHPARRCGPARSQRDGDGLGRRTPSPDRIPRPPAAAGRHRPLAAMTSNHYGAGRRVSVWARRRDLPLYFVLAFGLSWWPWPLVAVNPDSSPMVPFGPLLAAVIAAALTGGRRELRPAGHPARPMAVHSLLVPDRPAGPRADHRAGRGPDRRPGGCTLPACHLDPTREQSSPPSSPPW